MADVNVPELVPEPVELIKEDLDVVAGGKLTSASLSGQITTNSGNNEPPDQNKNLPRGLGLFWKDM